MAGKISEMNTIASSAGTDAFEISRSGATYRATLDQLKTYIQSQIEAGNLALAPTWNSGGTTFTGLGVNATDTASASASKLLDLQVGGVSKFTVRKDGVATVPAKTLTAAVAAAGANQGAATLLAEGWSSVTSGSGGVRLPAIAGGENFFIYNGLGSNLNVYPASGEQISGRTANAALTLQPQEAVLIVGRAAAQSMAFWSANQNIALTSFWSTNGAAQVYIDASNGINLKSDIGVNVPNLFFGSPNGQRAVMDSPANGQFRFKSFLTGDADFRNIMTFTGVLNAVNYLNVNPAVASSPPALTAAGTDTDIDLVLTPKNTGKVRFGAHSAVVAETVTGYITIKDAGGTERKVAVVS